jgi:hypothetical protein
MSVRIDIGDIFKCRICLEDDLLKNLISPCKCNGDIKYIHRDCLNKWINTDPNRITKCEICSTTYKRRGIRINYSNILTTIRNNFNGSNSLYIIFIIAYSLLIFIIDKDLTIADSIGTKGNGFLQETRIYYVILYCPLVLGICIKNMIYEINQLDEMMRMKYMKLYINYYNFIIITGILLYYIIGFRYTNILSDYLISIIIYICLLKNHIYNIDVINDELNYIIDYDIKINNDNSNSIINNND